jgi:peptide/nickel transport system substrate-binding protein
MPFASAAPVEDLSFVPLTPGNPLFSDGPYMVQGCNGTSTASGYNDCTGYNVGHSVTFVPNPTWQASTDTIRHQYVAQINLKLDLSGSAAENEVQQEITAGTTDLSFNTDVPTADLASLQDHHDSRFGSFPSPGITNPYLVFNVQSGNNNGALKNVKVRQALEYAINKLALTKIYGGPNFNEPLNQVIAPGAQGYVPFNDYPTPNNQGDPQKCQSLLKAAGYSSGSITLKDYYRDSGKHPAIFQEVQADLKKCGVNVVGTPISTGYYGSKGIGVAASTASSGDAILAQGAWDITEPGWVPDWFGPTNGRATLPDLFDGAINFPGTDWGGYDNPRVDQLVTQAESASNLQQANNLWHQADEQVMADAPFIPFMTQLTNLMRSSRVHNAIWLPFSASYDLTQIWVS